MLRLFSHPLPAVLLAQNLNSDDQDVVLKALKRVPESRLKKDGLKAMSSLLIEGNSKVVSAVSAQLRSLAENPRFRERVSAPGPSHPWLGMGLKGREDWGGTSCSQRLFPALGC